jgi:DNA repair exonuclease SbcCD ATPase subunit
MSRAAKLLLTKDKIMTVFASVDNICTELDECKAVAEKYNNEAPSLKRLIGGIVSGVAGAVLVALFFMVQELSPAVKYSLLAGGGAILLLAVILLAGRKKRSAYIVKNGNKIDVFQRIEELEETLSQKEVLIQSYLDGQTIEEFNEKWREAEQLLKTSTDEERRFCTSKPSAGFEETLSSIRKETEPVMEKIGYIQAEIDSLRASSNVSFSEAQEALNGIDEKINLLNDEYKAYALAYDVLEESIAEMQTTLCPGLCAKTEQIFNAITGRNIKVKIAEDFSIMVSDDSIPRGINSYSGATVDQAYFALRIALTDMISPKDETYPMMMDDPFVQYDDGRMSNGVEFLCSYVKNTEQSICHRDSLILILQKN